MNDEKQPEIGTMFKGQAWVELHGIFYAAQLRSLAEEIEKNCKNAERKDQDDQG